MAEDQAAELSTVDKVIAELNSGYDRAGGPKKSILGVGFVVSWPDAEENKVIGLVDVSAYQEDPYGNSGSTRQSFHLTLQDAWTLAQKAPRFRENFAAAAKEMRGELKRVRKPLVQKMIAARANRRAEKHAENMRGVESWCDQGLPTNTPTAIRGPLRLKTGGNSFCIWGAR